MPFAFINLVLALIFAGCVIIYYNHRWFHEFGERIFRSSWGKKGIILALVLVFLVIIIRTSWLQDDAYITFRVIYNFVNGYGLTWNVVERVQVFTHPLWMLLSALAYFITHEMSTTMQVLSICISVATVLLATFLTGQYKNKAIILIILILSKAFVDYSTSGLENSLSHLLLIVFFLLYFAQISRNKKTFLLSLLGALILVNRMDLALLIFPAFISYWLEKRSAKEILLILAGFLPFILWELFATFYYGFPFPNTAYAKLNVGIPAGVLISKGLIYLADCIQRDPITLPVIILGIFSAVSLKKKQVSIALGIALYMLYLIKIGGDYMSGRFLTAPLIVSIVLISRIDWDSFPKISYPVALILIVYLGLTAPTPTIYKSYSGPLEVFPGTGVADERLFYWSKTGLMSPTREQIQPNQEPESCLHQDYAEYDPIKKVAFESNIGKVGYCVGPSVYMIDRLALPDVLLARLPVGPNIEWRIGHFPRDLPDGYYESIINGKNMIGDDNLNKYYGKILLIIRGDLWDWQRLIEIINFNLGKYDDWLDKYTSQIRGS